MANIQGSVNALQKFLFLSQKLGGYIKMDWVDVNEELMKLTLDKNILIKPHFLPLG
jgi:hypothetical protein